ncbi:MAG: hypothetical protein KF777_01040 [Planctomycetaceae bacterium]|nr:hypothetical protein [Planctomycetaceae bacterium]
MAIGDLVVNLVARTKQFTNPLAAASNNLARFAARATALTGVIGGALSAKAAVQAAGVQLQAERKLAAVLNATAGAAGLSAMEIARYASELQSVTNYGDEATIAAAGILATFKNLKGDTFKEVIASAQDLSTVMDQDLNSSIVQIGKAMNDPIQGMSTLSRVGVSFTQQQRDQIRTLQESGDLLGAQAIIMAELKSEFGGAAKALADPFTQMKNTVGDASESIGTLLIPTLEVAARGVDNFFVNLANGRGGLAELGVEFAAFFQNIGLFFEYAGTSAAASFYKMDADLEHILLNAIPAYLTWLKNEWFNIFTDITNFKTVVMMNAVKKMASAWDWLLSYIKGNPIKWDDSSLMDGFVSSVKTLPQLPERALTDMETELNSMVSELKTRLDASMASSQAELGKRFNPTANMPAIPGLGKLQEDLSSLSDMAESSQDFAAPFVVPDSEERSPRENAGPNYAAAMTRGSQDAISTINRGMYGSGPESQKQHNSKMEKLTAEMLSTLKGMQGQGVDYDDGGQVIDFGYA